VCVRACLRVFMCVFLQNADGTISPTRAQHLVLGATMSSGGVAGTWTQHINIVNTSIYVDSTHQYMCGQGDAQIIGDWFPIYYNKIPIYSEKSPMYSERSPIDSEKSPIYPLT